MTVVWEVKRALKNGEEHKVSTTLTSEGKFVISFKSPDTGGHVFSGRDALFLRDVIAETVERLEFEIESADAYEKVKAFDDQAPAKAGKRWNVEEHAELMRLIYEGVTVGEISKQLERSPMAIVTRMLTHGIAEVVPVDPERRKSRD